MDQKECIRKNISRLEKVQMGYKAEELTAKLEGGITTAHTFTMDVIVAAEKRAIEVKAQHVLAKKYACRMEKDALADKIAYGKKMGYKLETRLIIVDDSTPDHIMAVYKRNGVGNFDVQSMEFVGSYDKFGKTLGIKFDKYGKRVGEATTSIKLKEAIEGYFGSSIGSNSLREGWSVLAEGGTKKFAMQKISASLDKSGAIMSAAARKKEMDLFSNVDIFNEFKSKINGAKASEKVLFRKTNGFLSTKVGDVVKFNTPQSFTSDVEYLKEFKGGTTLIIEPGAPAVSVDSILGMTDSLEDLLMGSFRVVDVQAKGSKRTIRMVYEKG